MLHLLLREGCRQSGRRILPSGKRSWADREWACVQRPTVESSGLVVMVEGEGLGGRGYEGRWMVGGYLESYALYVVVSYRRSEVLSRGQ